MKCLIVYPNSYGLLSRSRDWDSQQVIQRPVEAGTTDKPMAAIWIKLRRTKRNTLHASELLTNELMKHMGEFITHSFWKAYKHSGGNRNNNRNIYTRACARARAHTHTHTHTHKVSLLYGKQKMIKIIDKEEKCGTKFRDQIKFLLIVHIWFFT